MNWPLQNKPNNSIHSFNFADIAPDAINNEALHLMDWLTYEYLFFSITDSIVVYVLPTDYDGVPLYNDVKLISYYLVQEDLIRLNWKPAYPPDYRMKGINTETEDCKKWNF